MLAVEPTLGLRGLGWLGRAIPEPIQSLAVSVVGGSTRILAAAARSAHVYYSDEPAFGWHRTVPAAPSPGNGYALHVSPTDGRRVYAADASGSRPPLLSQDRGLTWSPIRLGPPGAMATRLVQDPSGTLYATFASRWLRGLRAWNGYAWGAVNLGPAIDRDRDVVTLSAGDEVLVGLAPTGATPTCFALTVDSAARPLGRSLGPRCYGGSGLGWTSTASLTTLIAVPGPASARTYIAASDAGIHIGTDLSGDGQFHWRALEPSPASVSAIVATPDGRLIIASPDMPGVRLTNLDQ